jgi:integrase
MRQRSSGSWELRVYAGVDPETRRRRYRTKTVRGSQAEAERALAALVAAVRADSAGGAGSSVSVLLERWFTVASRSWAPTTIRQTRSVLDRYLHPHIGSIPVVSLTAARIDELYADLGRSGSAKGGPLAAGTVARVHVVLRSALAQAVRWEWIWDNPAMRAHRITVSKRELQPPTPAELERLLTHVAQHDQQFYVFLVLAAFTGARRAQLLGLRWENVSLTAGRVAFRAGWVEGPDGPVLADTKTKQAHVVDLDPGTSEILARYAAIVEAPVGEGYMFSDDGGATAWKPNRVTKAFLRYRRAVGLRSFRLHDLRHFMATQMLEAGVPIVTVSRRLAHRRVSTTMDHYAHSVPGGDAHASAVLRAVFETAADETATTETTVVENRAGESGRDGSRPGG